MSVLYGLYSPDEGEMRLNGEPVVIDSPKTAIDRGIGMVFQHFMLVPVMTVAENIVLADEPRKGLLLDTKAAAKRVRDLSDRFGLAVDPDARVGDISVGQQQRVEILRALDRGADVLILDEPTAVLTAQETQELFRILRTLTAEGKSIVFISHKLGEVLDIADRVSVLRRGKKIETVSTEGATEESLARMMVGRDVLFRVAKEASKPGAPLLEVERARGGRRPRAAGRPGHRPSRCAPARSSASRGSTRTARASSSRRWRGCGAPRRARSASTGVDVTARGRARQARRRHRPHRRGPAPARARARLQPRREPVPARLQPRADRQARPDLAQAHERAGGAAARASTTSAAARADALALSLSGGNQQKVVIAREIAEEPKLLIAAQPTRGLDVGAIEFVHSQLIAQRDAGRGVLLVSLELEEIRSLSDRVLVMYDGRFVAELSPEASEEEFGVAMLGGRREASAS